jgi:spermidine synthase
VTRAARLARTASERGDLVLQQRDSDGALELRVNGVFVMDSVETTTERLLARAALDFVAVQGGGRPARALRVLIGGLGLGFTLDEVLLNRAVEDVVVVEIEADLVEWHRAGLVPATSSATRDVRVHIEVGDIVETVQAQSPMSVDVVLLDVDNGPGYLVYDDNAPIYRLPFLRSCYEATGPGGVTAVWASDASPELSAAMSDVFEAVEQVAVPVTLGARETTYHLFLGRRQGGATDNVEA